MKAARHSVEIDVAPERVYDLIVDFPSYPGFVPNQSAARVLAHEGNRWRVEFELSVARRLRYVLDLVGEPGRSVTWTLVEGDMMKRNDGGWRLEPLPGGRTLAHYEISVELKGFVPTSVARILIERTLPDNVGAFKAEAERRG